VIQGDDTRRRAASQGRVVVKIVSPRVLTSTVSGYLDRELGAQLVSRLDMWTRLGGTGLVAFHDCEGLADYASEARVAITQWSKAHRDRFREVHILVRSRAVAWGLKIINGLIGDVIIMHSDRTSFKTAQDAVFREDGRG
jgi:hypothetical protein